MTIFAGLEKQSRVEFINDRMKHQMVNFPWKTAVVAGLARSGVAAARLLAAHGVSVRATDLRSADELGLNVDDLEQARVSCFLEGHPDHVLDDVDLLVVSPGIPKTAPLLREARAKSIPILGELEIASRCARAPIAALTGTNGKSTCVTILGALLKACGVRHAVAGNVGRALSAAVEAIPSTGALAVEVSSYQLEDIALFHPRSAGILNVSPDHLDRYDSFEDYVQTKVKIFQNQGPEDTAVLPAHDDRLSPLASELRGRVLWFGENLDSGADIAGQQLTWKSDQGERAVLSWKDFPLPGRHNRINAAAAVCLAVGLGLDPTSPAVAQGLVSVEALPHRLQQIGTVGKVSFIDDSKATNPESLEVALSSCERPVVLVAGGLAKDSDYEFLVPLIKKHAAALVLIGRDAERLKNAWRDSKVPVVMAGSDFTHAIKEGFSLARTHQAHLLLSPGCASFDMFDDFVARGAEFAKVFAALSREDQW